jgi:hypothetical protein
MNISIEYVYEYFNDLLQYFGNLSFHYKAIAKNTRRNKITQKDLTYIIYCSYIIIATIYTISLICVSKN